MENCNLSLRGNHDTLVSDAEHIIILHSEVLQVAEWTVDQLEDKHLEFLRNLEKDYEDENVILTHDEPCIPGSMYYITKLKDAKDTLSAYGQQFCFYGHTHLPKIFVKDENTKEVSEVITQKYKIKDNERYLINVGSVGQPRDKDPRICYLIHDTEENSLEYVRVEYDVEGASKDIKNAGLPSAFAERLLIGK
jgi:diadenosine tetraphosphatase ApaH/serine/threonine PP2A family protein phosphatase